MLDRAYIRFRENIPDNANTYAAAEGFNMMGVPVIPFYGFGDLETLDLTPETIVCGNIGDVRQALKLIGKPQPDNVDYPSHLEWMLGRKVEVLPLETVRDGVRKCFVKPIQQKLFTGLVWSPDDPRSRLLVACYPHETPCYVSDVVEFVTEYRCFFKRGQPIGVRHYRGDPFVALDKKVYDKAVKCCKGNMPDAFVLDMGVTDDGRTLLVEANDAFAVGSYGLASIVYARMLETRWEQLVR